MQEITFELNGMQDVLGKIYYRMRMRKSLKDALKFYNEKNKIKDQMGA